MITVISWIAVVLVLAGYASGRDKWYAWLNVLLCIPIALPALLVGAYSSAAISLAFGVIAVFLLLKMRGKRACTSIVVSRESLEGPGDRYGGQYTSNEESRMRAPNRTNTDAVLVALMAHAEATDKPWMYVDDIAEATMLNSSIAWTTLRFLAAEYDAVEIMPLAKAARILDLDRYNAGGEFRNHTVEFAWPEER